MWAELVSSMNNLIPVWPCDKLSLKIKVTSSSCLLRLSALAIWQCCTAGARARLSKQSRASGSVLSGSTEETILGGSESVTLSASPGSRCSPSFSLTFGWIRYASFFIGVTDLNAAAELYSSTRDCDYGALGKSARISATRCSSWRTRAVRVAAIVFALLRSVMLSQWRICHLVCDTS